MKNQKRKSSILSIAAVVLCSGVIALTACKKDEVHKPSPAVKSDNQFRGNNEEVEALTEDEVKEYLSDYNYFLKNGVSKQKGLTDIPLQTAVDIMELALNSTYAVKHRDKDYVQYAYDTLYVRVDATENLLGTLVPSNDIYSEIHKVGKQIDQIALDAQRQFFAIDVEPYRLINGQLEFTVTSINALVIPKISYNVQELMQYTWKWGSAGVNGRSWECETVPSKYANGKIGGACHVVSLYLEDYYKEPVPELCAGYFDTRIKHIYCRYDNWQGRYLQFYDNEDGLNHGVPNLYNICVTPDELRQRYIPTLIDVLEYELNNVPNPYMLGYGSRENITVDADYFGSQQPNGPTPSHSMEAHLSDSYCQGILSVR